MGFSNRFHYENEEIIVVARGVGGTGDIKMTPKNCFLTNLSIAILLNSPNVNKNFLYYKLLSTTLWELRTGAAQAQITIEHLNRYEIEYPEIPVQRKISSILLAYDDLIENCQRRIKILEQMARAIYREWFVNFRYPGHEAVPLVDSPLGPIPQGWNTKLVSKIIIRANKGKVYTEADTQVLGDVPVIDQSTDDVLGDLPPKSEPLGSRVLSSF